jgi:hypothetical protein
VKKIDISLNFMPAFYTKHLGLKYGEAYYFDPDYRKKVEKSENLFLYEILGKYGVSSPNPEPNPVLFVQPIDLIMRTQGAPWRFPMDSTVESIGNPWASLEPVEIERIDPNEAAHHPVIERLLALYKEMTHTYGDRADILSAKSGTMTIHTPFTTAHQLYGEELFIIMLTEPELASRIFYKIWDIYKAIYARIANATGTRISRVMLGDCSASLLSSDTYSNSVLPVNAYIAGQFKTAGYHSCGHSSHLISDFAKLPNLDAIQLGFGTNLTEITSLMPGVHVQPLTDAVNILMNDADTVSRSIEGILDDTMNAEEVTLCVWGLDRDTPIENVEAIYDSVTAHKK